MADQAEFTFDLSRISLDDALYILEYDEKNVDPTYIRNFVKAIRACLVKGSRELTGADLPVIIQAFSESIMGGGAASKN